MGEWEGATVARARSSVVGFEAIHHPTPLVTSPTATGCRPQQKITDWMLSNDPEWTQFGPQRRSRRPPTPSQFCQTLFRGWLFKKDHPFNHQIIVIFTHLNLCLADAIHNFKWVKIIQIWQNGGWIFSNLADICHVLSLTYLKGDTYCANKKTEYNWESGPAVKGLNGLMKPVHVNTNWAQNRSPFQKK